MTGPFPFHRRCRLSLVLSGLLAVCHCGLFELASRPTARAGLLDLRGWDFERDGAVHLDGEWEFYWQDFVDPASFAVGEAGPGAAAVDAAAAEADRLGKGRGLLRFPGSWNAFEVDGKPIGADGYGTFRLRVLVDDPGGLWELATVDIFTAHRVFVNGRPLGGRGRLARSADEYAGLVTSTLFKFESDGSRVLDIVVHQSNYGHFEGFSEDLILGPAPILSEARERRVAFEVFICGALVIMGIYHLFLFALRREDRSTLFFGMFCLLIAAYTLLTGHRYLIHLFPEPGHDIYWKLIFVILPAAPVAFVAYLQALFPRDTGRYFTRSIIVLGGLLALLALALPPRQFTELLAVYILFTAGSTPYSLFVILRAMIKRREGTLVFLPGFLVLVIGALNDGLYSFGLLNTGFYSGFALMLFVFFQAILLSMRFARAFHTVTNLTGELANRNRDLNRLDRLKNEFLANTSHELRTPLNGIIGIADSLREGAAGPLNEQARRNLDLIVYSGSRLAGLINDILDFQKLRNDDVLLERRPVDLRQATDVVLAVSRPLVAGKDLVLRNELPPGLPSVLADENRLQQILHNLVGNAIKFTPEGEIVVAARVRDDMVEISVRDNGIGIPFDRQADIFQSFKQVDASAEREFGGSGLGLSISRRLVELHEGRIWVDSTPGEGSTFRFTLPASPEAPVSSGSLSPRIRVLEPTLPLPGVASELAVENDKQKEERSGRTILVVDDESLNRHVLVNLLSVRKYNVLEAGDGVEALRILESESLPDAVLLDIMMPRMNGYEVCRKIRETYSPAELPVIFLSAKNEVEDLIAGLESGGNDYLSKPFAAPELLARVESQTNLKRIHAEALELREKLVDQEKLAAVGSMAAGIVHDFKTPVSIIKGYTELADDATINRDERSQFLQIVTREADHLADMAQDILEYTRGSFRLQKRKLQAAEFLEMGRKALLPYLAPRNIVHEIVQEYRGEFSVDPQRFLRVLVNVAANAADVMREGGVFETKLAEERGRVLLSMKDSGSGIPEEIRDTLFDPFVTRDKQHGTGLGLAITKSIIEAHGGSIDFETGAAGTTFFVRLPKK